MFSSLQLESSRVSPYLDVRVVVNGDPSRAHFHILHEHQFNGGRPWEHSFMLQGTISAVTAKGQDTASVPSVPGGCLEQVSKEHGCRLLGCTMWPPSGPVSLPPHSAEVRRRPQDADGSLSPSAQGRASSGHGLLCTPGQARGQGPGTAGSVNDV